ncbi:MAG: hypothetical protein SVV80_10235 [Planctomycetota bacterium]|nr:hypothetical protein [Planctomycetota bacterium]
MARRTVSVLFIMFFALSLWADSTKGADAPTLEEIRNLPVAGPVGFSARGKIEEYVGHWVKKMTEAKKVSDIVKARQALTDGYDAHNSPDWLVSYAEVSAKKIPVLLGLSDRVKQIQASMALAAMPQYTIQPALEKMSLHENPAVRYWAARGYRSSVRRMLLYPERARKMCATLERLGRKESGPILAVVLRTLIIYPGMRAEAVARLRSTLDKIWLARLGDLLAGRSDIIETYHKTVEFLTPFDKDEADKKKILQLLVDALEAASQGFNESGSSKKSAQQPWMDLLSELERKLNAITDTRKAPIQDILVDTKMPINEKVTEVRLKAVQEHWKPLLAKLDVKPRPVPVTKTKPANMTKMTPE